MKIVKIHAAGSNFHHPLDNLIKFVGELKRKAFDLKKISRIASLVLVLIFVVSASSAGISANAVVTAKSSDQSIFVDPVPGLSPNFAMGADISTLPHLEEKGFSFYNNGNKNDAMTILNQNGINWIRVRVWNNPSGGGYCDEAKALSLAQRAKRLGMKFLLDFHYSDTWADPSWQAKPAAWANDSGSKLAQDVYQFTAQVIGDMKKQGTTPDMVQVGNEINNGMLWPDGRLYLKGSDNYDGLAQLLNAGIHAVRDNQPAKSDGTKQKIQIMLHIANSGEAYAYDQDNWFFNKMKAAGVTDFDVIGLSAYPYWHGSFSDLKTTMSKLVSDFDKPICIAETAYAYTLDNYDNLKNNFCNKDSNMEEEGGYTATVQGQATEIRDAIAAVSSLGKNGFGVFYWEPEWIAGSGSDSGQDGSGDSWENQTLFDRDGNALPSIKTFRLVYSSQKSVNVSAISIHAVSVSTTVGMAPSMPATVYVVNNDGSIVKTPVTWNSIFPSEYSQVGSFQVNGTVQGTSLKATATVDVSKNSNLLQNSGFEKGNTDLWTVTDSEKIASLSTSTPYEGAYSLHYYANAAASLRVFQTVSGLKNGTYLFTAHCDGLTNSAVKVFAENFGGNSLSTQATNKGWKMWQSPKIIVTVSNGQCTVGISVSAQAGDWGDLDSFSFQPCDSSGNPT